MHFIMFHVEQFTNILVCFAKLYNNVNFYILCKFVKSVVLKDAIIVVRNAKIVVACISGLCYNRCMKIRGCISIG